MQLFFFKMNNWYFCFYPHWSRCSVSPVFKTFFLLTSSLHSVSFNIYLKEEEKVLNPNPHQPLATEGKILNNEAFILTASSIQEQGANFSKPFFLKEMCW